MCNDRSWNIIWSGSDRTCMVSNGGNCFAGHAALIIILITIKHKINSTSANPLQRTSEQLDFAYCWLDLTPLVISTRKIFKCESVSILPLKHICECSRVCIYIYSCVPTCSQLFWVHARSLTTRIFYENLVLLFLSVKVMFMLKKARKIIYWNCKMLIFMAVRKSVEKIIRI